MAAFLDACRFNPTAGGTTDWTVSAAVVGYMAPVTAGAVNGRVYKYRAESADLSQWEIGEGAYTVAGTVLARTTVLFNSAGTTAKINFSAAPQVAIIAIKEDLLSIEEANAFTATQRAQARTNISAALKGQIFGLTLSTGGTSSSFAAAAGEAADSTAADLMVLASSLQKNTGAWSLGVNGGALDTGSIAPSTWYHVFQIKRPDTGVVDIAISLSATTPNLTTGNIPTAYTLFRRIGSIKTDVSSNWTRFFQNGDEFLWSAPVADASALAITNAVSSVTLSVPTGIVVNALFQGDYTSSAIVQGICLLYSPATATQAAGTPAGNWSLTNAAVGVFCSNPFNIRTNTSGQISAVAGQAANNSLYIITAGWIDTRGRLG